MVNAKVESPSKLTETLEPVPAHILFPPNPSKQESGSCCHCCTPTIPVYEADANGILSYSVRPSACDTFFMLPCFMFLGCCFGVSANVTFNNNEQTVKISNWPGYMCCWPCLQSTKLDYNQVANIGIVDTGGREGSENNQQPIYDVILVEEHAKNHWVVGSRGSGAIVRRQATDLHRFLFAQNNPNYTSKCEWFVIPDYNSCCFCWLLVSRRWCWFWDSINSCWYVIYLYANRIIATFAWLSTRRTISLIYFGVRTHYGHVLFIV